jgi:hypothetical protein
MITEAKTGMSVGLPMKRLEEGTVGVIIPDMQGMFQEGVDYTGQLEVIVGSRWFNPVTVGLVFERDVKVEATPILSKETKAAVKPIQEAVGAENKPSPVINPTPKPKSMVNEKALLNALFSDKKRTKIQPGTQPQLVRKQPPLNPKLAKLKNNLKSMITEAWNELES